MKGVRKLLFPFSLLYGFVVWIRNFLYDKQIFKSISYDFPIICVGNLRVGGTGKTPMIAYLIELLQKDYSVGVLSRGYRRKTKGFVLADKNTTAMDVGDEPHQLYKKFKDSIVSVDENRVHGVNVLMRMGKPLEVLLLDDAFQHRKIRARFNILLTSYNDLYVDDFMLPMGNLRDGKKQAKRADIVVVTKCPMDLSKEKQHLILKKLGIGVHQKVFFSGIQYGNVLLNEHTELSFDVLKQKRFTLVTAIANAKPLVSFLKERGLDFEHLRFADHHHFSDSELSLLSKKDFLLTTEKDFTKLYVLTNCYYLPIAFSFLKEQSDFNDFVLDFIKNVKA